MLLIFLVFCVLGSPPVFGGVNVAYLFSFLCAVSLRPVSCVPNVTSVSILHCPFRLNLTFIHNTMYIFCTRQTRWVKKTANINFIAYGSTRSVIYPTIFHIAYNHDIVPHLFRTKLKIQKG